MLIHSKGAQLRVFAQNRATVLIGLKVENIILDLKVPKSTVELIVKCSETKSKNDHLNHCKVSVK